MLSSVIKRMVTKILSFNHLFLLVVVTLVVTFVLLGTALLLYKLSGTAQLDLSRPGYETARDQSETVKPDEFSPSGALNDQTIEDFKAMYDQRAERIEGVNAFGPDPLSDATLSITE
jgi:hypothetical protein